MDCLQVCYANQVAKSQIKSYMEKRWPGCHAKITFDIRLMPFCLGQRRWKAWWTGQITRIPPILAWFWGILDELFTCLRQLSSHSDSNTILFKVQRQEILKTTCASKKTKFNNDPAITEATCITTIRDLWLINNNKTNFDLKA